MKTVDTKGMLCPAPLVMTKRAIDSAAIGQEFEVITDNDTACSNLTNYLEELGIKPLVESREAGETRLYFRKPEGTKADVSATEHCSTAGYAVVVKSNTMGGGDDTLGAMLMRAFINNLGEAERLPTHIVMYNSGIRLALSGSDTCESLKKLEAQGVTIVVCGTCVDFFEVRDKLEVGVISNMFAIIKIVSQAGHVVYP